MSIDTKRFVEFLRRGGFSPRSYSGNVMYGKSCVSVDVERGQSLFTFGMDIAYAVVSECVCLGEDPEDMLAEVCNISAMVAEQGLDSTIYFPSLEWPADLTSW